MTTSAEAVMYLEICKKADKHDLTRKRLVAIVVSWATLGKSSVTFTKGNCRLE